MLYIVLILVVAALGLVVTALITTNSLWAWISIGLSVLAGVVLLVDWLRKRSAGGGSAEAGEGTDASGDSEDTAGKAEKAGQHGESGASEEDGATTKQPTNPDEDEPVEEKTDAADLLIVVGLTHEVLVVDEHPRYHLEECTWLRDRATIPIPINEARELKFTPCARCKPDATLAGQHRSTRRG